MTLYDVAVSYLDAGLSVIPADVKTKKATHDGRDLKWKPYQQVRATHEDAAKFWANGAGIACIAGPISGNLEFIDIDEPGLAKEWKSLLESWNCGSLLSRLLLESSQTKGRLHIAYRHEGKPQGNQKLANRPATPEELALKPTQKVYGRIETRGDGGYCIIAPTPGYTLRQGDWTQVPTITSEEREALLAASRTFDLCPEEYISRSTGGRVGDDYNAKALIDNILEPLGWTRVGRDGWRRPGKSLGTSASWNHRGNGHFVVFTTSTELNPGNYDLFGLYCRLYHGGNFIEAAKGAAALGFGQESRQPTTKVNRSGARQWNSIVTEESVCDRKWFTFDEIDAEPIDWLCEPYIPLGIGYTYLYGDSDHGKSTCLLALIAAFSRGYDPINKRQIEPVRSIILSAEDSAKYVVKPRLAAFNADMRLIMAPEEFNEDGTPNPMTLYESSMEELHDKVLSFNAKIVLVDPLTAYFDGDNINDRMQARSFTRRLTNMAIQCHCAPILTHHVNKATGMQGRYRGSGSQDFFDASRSALMAVRAGGESPDYALSHEKHNLTVRGDSIGYTFSKERGFEWTGVSDLTSDLAQAAMEEHVPKTQIEACKSWIYEQLAQGPMKSDDMKQGAKNEGYSFATMKRAKESMRADIRSYKEATENG